MELTDGLCLASFTDPAAAVCWALSAQADLLTQVRSMSSGVGCLLVVPDTAGFIAVLSNTAGADKGFSCAFAMAITMMPDSGAFNTLPAMPTDTGLEPEIADA